MPFKIKVRLLELGKKQSILWDKLAACPCAVCIHIYYYNSKNFKDVRAFFIPLL